MNSERLPVPETLDLTASHRRGRKHLYRKRQLWSLRPGRPPLPLELTSSKCDILMLLGSYETVRGLLQTMVPKAEALGDRRWAASMAAELAHVLTVLGEAGAALPHAERARAIYLEIKDEAGLARSLHVLSGVCSDLDMNDRARELTRDLLELAERTGQEGLSVQTIYSLREELGVEPALDRIRGYLEKSRSSGNKALSAMCLFYLGDIYMNTGRWAEAEACNLEQYKLACETGNRMAVSFAVGDRGLIFHGQGRYHEAIECYMEKLEISEAMGDFYNVFEALDNAGVAYRELGEPARALELINRAEAHTRRHQVQHFLGKSLYLKAKCLLDLREYRRSSQAIKEAMDIAKDIGDHEIEIRGCLLEAQLAAVEDSERAVSMLRSLLEKLDNDELRAEAHFELFRLTGDAGHKARALEHYRRYYEATKLYCIDRRIAELEGR